jgi:large subunit ribosomal protein L15
MSIQRNVWRQCRSSQIAPYLRQAIARRPASTVATEQEDAIQPLEQRTFGDQPRWAQTPPAMKSTFSLNTPKTPQIWHVNEDPAKLDAIYERLLGGEVTRALPEELKWLAVTHKTFDQGRRGFNTKLAFYGEPSSTGAPAGGLQPS